MTGYPKRKYHPSGGSIEVGDAHQEKAHPEFNLNEPPVDKAADAKAKAADAKAKADADAAAAKAKAKADAEAKAPKTADAK